MRINEWFVPKFGPTRFRLMVGLLFLPYTGMCVSFALIGAMLAPVILWDRTLGIALIYFLGVGISAHALDSLGSKKVKPWGSFISTNKLWILSLVALIPVFALGIYYSILVPLLFVLAIAEGFFLFAYNLELFNGRFHTDLWFAFSWGSLPLLAGYVIQTGTIAPISLIGAGGTGIISYLHIKTSRPYKELRRSQGHSRLEVVEKMRVLERTLKVVSLGTISGAVMFLIVRGTFL